MKVTRRIAKNTLVRTVAEVLNIVLSTIFLIFVARYLGSVDFGKYSFALSFAGLFVIFTDLGFHTLFIREVARNEGKTGRLYIFRPL